MEQNLPNIYASLRERIHDLQYARQFRIFSQEQYTATISNITSRYFETQHLYLPEILEGFQDEIDLLLSSIDSLVQRSEVNIEPVQLFSGTIMRGSLIPENEQREGMLTENKKKILEELEYYLQELTNLIISRDQQERLNIEKARGKLKMFLPSKDILALFLLMRESKLMNVPSTAELCRFISQNFHSIKTDDNLSPRSLAKLTPPDAPTIASVKSTLNAPLKNIAKLKDAK